MPKAQGCFYDIDMAMREVATEVLPLHAGESEMVSREVIDFEVSTWRAHTISESIQYASRRRVCRYFRWLSQNSDDGDFQMFWAYKVLKNEE